MLHVRLTIRKTVDITLGFKYAISILVQAVSFQLL